MITMGWYIVKVPRTRDQETLSNRVNRVAQLTSVFRDTESVGPGARLKEERPLRLTKQTNHCWSLVHTRSYTYKVYCKYSNDGCIPSFHDHHRLPPQKISRCRRSASGFKGKWSRAIGEKISATGGQGSNTRCVRIAVYTVRVGEPEHPPCS